ncbi:hypothetical protein [Nocardia sp. CC201C]|uniref:hypothetical protein n=1 Tax=Nocardia sp. CC201C TaxID=3044575 RepID=UPI0024A80159|nr:hypothetical protein [Nocardia sp. CC201C]
MSIIDGLDENYSWDVRQPRPFRRPLRIRGDDLLNVGVTALPDRHRRHRPAPGAARVYRDRQL